MGGGGDERASLIIMSTSINQAPLELNSLPINNPAGHVTPRGKNALPRKKKTTTTVNKSTQHLDGSTLTISFRRPSPPAVAA